MSDRFRLRPSTGGFTLIELLISLVIVSLLMAIAVPMLSYLRERGYITAMKSDLRNLAVMEESYFYDNSYYTGSLSTLEARGFVPSRGVAVEIHEAAPTGWSATVTHDATPWQCHLFVGDAAPVGPATDPGAATCG